MEYDFRKIEQEWQKKWKESNAYHVSNESDKPKFYVLDMFPYPSGAGLHVGHPLGYIASDIYARYKRLKGFNVLHPMGYDAFGLPAEQYAIDHGIHPAISTENNINTFRKQLDNIGFSFDWSREVRTSDPDYYKWTQWIFLQLFNSFFNREKNKAENIQVLVASFEAEGNVHYSIPNTQHAIADFTADEWKRFDEKTQQDILMQYRLAYCGFGEVNWCEALGTVLANDEVVNGVSERGGYPVVKKKLRQWYLRITEYADRLLEGLGRIEFSEAMKEMQSNWIGKSSGAEIDFRIRIGKPTQTSGEIAYQDSATQIVSLTITDTESGDPLRVYTTRPDTIFGVDFMVIAPELELVEEITTSEQKQAVEDYIAYVKSRSERERQAEKKITGVFTGAYAINPFDGREIPIWISEYVLAGYGTGAIMAVPCGDERDFKFAKHFNIPITNIIGKHFNGEEANPTKDAVLENSDFINGMVMKDAIEVVVKKIEESGIGTRKINYKMRDAAFSRQRYWGEPFPIIWKDGIAYPIDESELPLTLPDVEKYSPGPDGEGPLANIPEWYLIPNPSPQVEKGNHLIPNPSPQAEKGAANLIVDPSFQVEKGKVGAGNVPKYSVYTPVQFELARRMRKQYTEAEGELWEVLRGNKLGVKFRRQHPISAYIVDFISLQEKLIVEVDGGYHETEEQKKYDEERTRVLKEIGFNIIRFSNEDVMKDVFIVRNKIKAKLAESASIIPSPLVERGQGVRETNTMPGYAGSSWYFLRYMDPHNDKEFCNRKVSDYWGQVDLYIGGTEHAVGHLLYSRMWTKALYDLGHIGHDEPYKKLVNQGMIQGSSRFVYRITPVFTTKKQLEQLSSDEIFDEFPVFISRNSRNKIVHDNLNARSKYFEISDANNKNHHLKAFTEDEILFVVNEIHVDVNFVDGEELDIYKFRAWREEYSVCLIELEEGRYICGSLVEKMSKRLYNTINPDDLVAKYGADTFRMYEMFLGPVEQSKPWDTKGIEGVHRFLKKLWRLFYSPDEASAKSGDDIKGKLWNEEKATDAELKVLHKTIKQIEEATERFSFNTGVSGFMIAVNELTDLKCHKREILEPLLILLTPYAPHIAEELYNRLQENTLSNDNIKLSESSQVSPTGGDLEGAASILDANYPKLEEKYLIESSKEYPVSVNGKLRTTINIALGTAESDVEQIVLANQVIQKWLEGKQPKKIIYKEGKMVNVVL